MISEWAFYGRIKYRKRGKPSEGTLGFLI